MSIAMGQVRIIIIQIHGTLARHNIYIYIYYIYTHNKKKLAPQLAMGYIYIVYKEPSVLIASLAVCGVCV